MAELDGRRVPRPYYLFRPTQLAKRRKPFTGTVELAFGGELQVFDDMIGRALHRQGVYDIAVMEAIFRLLDPDELAVDAGANVGSVTRAMLARTGRVLAFEPDPDNFHLLARNCGDATLYRMALSDHTGYGYLSEPEPDNRGTSALAEHGTPVAVARLDSIVRRCDFMKLDVEGHELEVLRGAPAEVRDVVFEDHRNPSPVAGHLRESGYTVWTLSAGWLRPLLNKPRPHYEAQSYLATVAPDRAAKRMRGIGWRSLK